MNAESRPSPEAAVRDAFAKQAAWSIRLSSPFMSGLCATLAAHLDRTSEVGRRVLDWSGEPDALHDALPLRIAGGLHALVRRGRVPDLAALYPPNRLPEATTMWPALRRVFASEAEQLLPWLDRAPQTNEVARSAVLVAGLLAIAEATRRPLVLEELGASAGLNLILDRYAYRLGRRFVGVEGAKVMLTPYWQGGEPPEAELRVIARRGVDLSPLDATDPADRERILAYIWPDQLARIARTEAALALVAADPPTIDRGDAAEWLERRLAEPVEGGAVRVVMHSIAFQYFGRPAQLRIRDLLEATGSRATPDDALAWLRYETDPEFGNRPSLRLRVWPDGSERVLALGDAHANQIDWQA